MAGGSFAHADGKPAPGLAFWDGHGWNPIEGGVEGARRGGARFSRARRTSSSAAFAIAGGQFLSASRSGPVLSGSPSGPETATNNGRVDGFDLLALARQWNREGAPTPPGAARSGPLHQQ
ncbi:MAG: hypothetical protein R3E97_21970 [Candidatus Eisenbacteria bacterium]